MRGASLNFLKPAIQSVQFYVIFKLMNDINIHRIDMNLLAVFQTLIAERHVGRAAKRIGVTQSAASHSLTRLRALFGDPLFVRHPKGIEPTARALTLAPAIAEIIERTCSVLSSTNAFDATMPHRFTIGAADLGVFTILLPLMRQLRTTAPAMDIRVRLTNSSLAIQAFDRQEIDLALSPLSAPPARIDCSPGLRDRYVGIARRGHPAITRLPMSVDAFAALPFLLVAPLGGATSQTDEQLAKLGLRRRIVMVVPHFLSAPMLVASTDLVAVISERVASYFASQLDIVLFEPPIPLQDYTINLLTSAARAEDMALRWLKEQIELVCSEPKFSSARGARRAR